MAITVNTNGFDINFAQPIDKRLIVDRVDGTTASLVSLEPAYNYRNMYVWVREEKSFYYLIDTPEEGGATFSDWTQASGGVGSGCGKSGYVSGASFSDTSSLGPPLVSSTASVVFDTPYSSASYSVSITSHAFDEVDYVYSVIDKAETGFTIRTDITGPLGATAMWITNCFDGSGLSSGVGGGPGGGSAIDLEEIAFGTGTGITSSDVFTFNNTNTSLILGYNTITDSRSSAIIGGTGNNINSSTKFVCIDSNLITSAMSSNVKDSFYSSIQSSLDSIICGSTASSIITSYNTTLRSSCYSTIIDSHGYKNLGIIPNGLSGSCHSTLIGSYTSFINNSCYSSMINTCAGCIVDSRYASIFLSELSCIVNTGVGGQHRNLILNGETNIIYKSRNASILNSANSCIFTTTVGYTSFSNIIGGEFNKICNSLFSNSIGGQYNKIYDSCASNSIGGQCNRIYDSCSSGIIGGFCSSLTSSTPRTYFNSIFYSSHSQIVGNTFSRFNIIMGSTGSSIKYLGTGPVGKGNTIRNPNNSLIIGGNCNTILGACNSVILGGCGITIIGVTTSVYSSAQNCRFNNVVAVPSLIGFGSLSLSVKTASTTDYPGGLDLDNNYFTLIAYPDDPGSLDVCLPQADALGRIYVIKKAGTSTYSTVKIYPRGSECIDGYAGYVELINPWDYNMLQADGVDNWLKLGGAVGINL